MPLTDDARESLRRISAEIDRLTTLAENEPNPQMAAEYRQQAEYAQEKGRQIYAAGRGMSGSEKIRALAQGATFGLADELEAGLRTGAGLMGDYGQTRDEIRQANYEARQNFPQDVLGLELAGSAPWMAINPGGAWVKNAAGTPGMLARTAALGTGEGALYGFGKSEADTLAGQGIDTATGAGLGLATAAGLTAGALAPDLGRRMMNVLRKSPTERADDVIAQVVQQTGLDADRIRQMLDDLGPEATLADLNTEMQKLLLATRQRSPAAGNLIDETIGARQAGGQARLAGDIAEASGVTGDVNREILNLKNMRRIFDKPAYKRARGQTVTLEDETIAILQNPAVKNDANNILRFHNLNVDDLEPGQQVSVGVIDDIKKNIDRTIAGKLEDNVGRVVTEGQVPEAQYLRRGQQRLVGAADEAAPDYARARAQHAYFSQQLDPIDAGRRYAAATDDQVRFEMLENYNKLPADQQFRFRQGVVSDLMRRLGASGGARGTGFAGSGMGLPGVRHSRFAGASGNDAAKAQKLEDAFQREGTFYETYALTNPNVGSKTSAADSGAQVADEAAGLLTNMARTGAGDMTAPLEQLRSMRGLSKPMAEEIAKRLTNNAITPAYIERLANDTNVPLELFDWLKQHIGLVTRSQVSAQAVGQGLLED